MYSIQYIFFALGPKKLHFTGAGNFLLISVSNNLSKKMVLAKCLGGGRVRYAGPRSNDNPRENVKMDFSIKKEAIMKH